MPGKFIVRIEAHGFETEYYDDVEDREDASEIELTPTTVPIKPSDKAKIRIDDSGDRDGGRDWPASPLRPGGRQSRI